MNTGSLSPFGCFYCRTSFLNFTEAIIHSTSSHDSLVLKVRSLELNSSTGKIGYRIHNFNVIPKELKSAGQSIQADPTDDKLSIRITRTGGEEITISSPTSKKSRRCTSKDTNTTIDDEMSVDINTDLETLTNLLPSVVETLKRKGKIETWIKFNKLLSTDSFPLENIAFLLFLDVVKWFDSGNTTSMRYEDPVVNKFWRIGYKMFHGKWLRFMSGPKSRGGLINNITSPGNFDPTQSRINFSVPFAKVKSTSESPVPPSQVKPGILTHLLDKFAEQACMNQTFKLCFDGEKINSSISDKSGDIDLFGFEGSPTLLEKQERLLEEKDVIGNLKYVFQEQSVKNKVFVEDISENIKENF
jgi:hypothetical protein